MKVLMKGNEALSEAAIRAGATLYFGYPITPQNEVGEYMSRRLPTIPGGAYIQAETEVASINMVYGAVVHRTAGDDQFLVAGHQPDDGGDFLPRRRRTAGGHRQHHARAARGWATSTPSRPTTSRRPRAAATAATG